MPDTVPAPGSRRIPQAPMADYTTFRLGGPCRLLIDCPDEAALVDTVQDLSSRGESFLLIGGGSNLLVSDEGLDTTVVRFAADAADMRREGDVLDVGAASPLDAVAAAAVDAGLEGFVFASGIPGTVGGAVVGNAGAFGEQIGDRVLSLDLLDAAGRLRRAQRDEVSFAYRDSSLKRSGDIVLRVRLQLRPGDRASLSAERRRILAWRRERHPDWRALPCAGSFFRNLEPTSAAGRRQAAGWFLEQAGAREFRVGGARLFDKHANIIVRGAPECTAQDVFDLSRRMAAAVRERFGFDLAPEVRILGAFRS